MKKPSQLLARVLPWFILISCIVGIVSGYITLREYATAKKLENDAKP